VYLVSAYGHLGRVVDAQKALATANALRAKQYQGALTISTTREKVFKWPGKPQLLRDGLLKAHVNSGAEWLSRMPPAGSSGIVDIEGVTTIDTETAKALHDRGVPFVYVHSRPVRISGAHYLDVSTDEFNEIRLLKVAGNKSEEVVMYGVGGRFNAANSAAMAASWGFEKIYYLDFPKGDHLQGGFYAWKEAGYPLERFKFSPANEPAN